MRQYRAIKQLAVFMLVLILYILWYVHPVFIGPSLRFAGTVPTEAERVVRDFYGDIDMAKPEDFAADNFIYAFCHPYRIGDSHYVATMEIRTSCRINRLHHGAWLVVLEDGKRKISNDMIIY